MCIASKYKKRHAQCGKFFLFYILTPIKLNMRNIKQYKVTYHELLYCFTLFTLFTSSFFYIAFFLQRQIFRYNCCTSNSFPLMYLGSFLCWLLHNVHKQQDNDRPHNRAPPSSMSTTSCPSQIRSSKFLRFHPPPQILSTPSKLPHKRNQLFGSFILQVLVVYTR